MRSNLKAVTLKLFNDLASKTAAMNQEHIRAEWLNGRMSTEAAFRALSLRLPGHPDIPQTFAGMAARAADAAKGLD